MSNNNQEKRMLTVSFKTTDKIVKAIDGLSVVGDMSRSDFIHSAISELVEKKEAEARILIDALGIKVI